MTQPLNPSEKAKNGNVHIAVSGRKVSFAELLDDRNRLAERNNILEKWHYHALKTLFEEYADQLEKSGILSSLIELAKHQQLQDPRLVVSQALTSVVIKVLEQDQKPTDLGRQVEAEIHVMISPDGKSSSVASSPKIASRIAEKPDLERQH